MTDRLFEEEDRPLPISLREYLESYKTRELEIIIEDKEKLVELYRYPRKREFCRETIARRSSYEINRLIVKIGKEILETREDSFEKVFNHHS